MKSTSIFGGSQVLIVILGIIRAKVVAILLGPMGVGIIGIYQSVIDMLRTTASLGIDTSGIREIASHSENKINQNRIIYKLNWCFLATALIGLIITIIFCYPISIWAFDTDAYALPIALLSICVFLAILTTGRSVILQGTRKISYMAQSAVWGSLISLLISIPLYYALGIKGIIPSLIASSIVLYACVEYYYRKLETKPISTSKKEILETGISTLKLGIYIVVAGVINTGSMFLVRTYISREIDLDAAGLFQSAWTITNVYLGLILKSMGTDFFPRLAALSEDQTGIKKLVNEQSYIVLIIAVPIIIIMLFFSELALYTLYSSKFVDASAILQWQILGSFFKIMSWPIAFIILAKNKGFLFLISEVIFYAVYLISFYLLFSKYSLDAAGIAYLIAYAVYLPTIYYLGYKISKFSWSREITKTAIICLFLICIGFYISHIEGVYRWILGFVVILLSCVYSFYNLKNIFSLNELKDWFRKK